MLRGAFTDELTIEQLGAPVLRRQAHAVSHVDDEVRELARRMFPTMHAANGQGLAAPQVGVSRRIAIVDFSYRQGPVFVLVNPRLVAASEHRTRCMEGCLSLPGVSAVVERPAEVVVESMNLEGETVRLEATGELARCFQHEVDHLDGILYIDRLSPLARRMLLHRYHKRRRAWR